MTADQPERGSLFEAPPPAGDADAGAESTTPMTRAGSSPERIQHVADHIASIGRLNIHVLATEWDVSPTQVVNWLTAMHRQGNLERLEHAPYFHILAPDRIRSRP
jgi:hypothetical protein